MLGTFESIDAEVEAWKEKLLPQLKLALLQLAVHPEVQEVAVIHTGVRYQVGVLIDSLDHHLAVRESDVMLAVCEVFRSAPSEFKDIITSSRRFFNQHFGETGVWRISNEEG